VIHLDAAWERCFEDLGGSRPPPCVWEELQARYSEPHRAYHSLQHLEECFTWFEQIRSFADRPGEIAFALFYHDAIYDSRASDNEKQSADLAASVLKEYVRGDSDPERVTSLIFTTKHDAVSEDGDAQLLVDVDLSILGASPERFDEYERQVRKEYDWVSSDAFREGRSKILVKFLERPTIFGCSYFRERLETAARANLERSLVRLGATASTGNP
jgi:predicted metal-dependent HD superfamily phosphohydrolase